jgi:lysophospholipase L1-like esterase
MAQILIFGDSVAYGAWDKEGGWVQRLRKFLDKQNIKNIPNFTLIYNLSVSGDTTEDIIIRFDIESKAYLKNENAHLIIFSIGSNDSRYINKKPAVNPEKFRKNIIELIKNAKKHTTTIIFVGLTPIYPAFVQWSKTETYRMEDIQKYDQIIKSVCKESDTHFIEIFDEFQKVDYKKLLEDGVHPNSEGHQKIFEIVKDFLVEEEII